MGPFCNISMDSRSYIWVVPWNRLEGELAPDVHSDCSLVSACWDSPFCAKHV